MKWTSKRISKKTKGGAKSTASMSHACYPGLALSKNTATKKVDVVSTTTGYTLVPDLSRTKATKAIRELAVGAAVCGTTWDLPMAKINKNTCLIKMSQKVKGKYDKPLKRRKRSKK